MKWEIHSGIIIGTEHERTKRNKQDFCGWFTPRNPGEKRYGGVICDGCSAGAFSEVGAALTGSFILQLLKNKEMTNQDTFKGYIEKRLSRFIKNLPVSMSYTSIKEKVHFIQTFFLTTFIFVVIEENILHIGYSGDGVIIINDQAEIIDQQGKPHYFAYRNIPDTFFTEPVPPGQDFFINTYSTHTVKKIAIASDGIIPLIQNHQHKEIFGTSKRQLQRKFNVWQQKDKLFYDDVSCIVFEKKEE